jgi:hypothetical protein
MPTLNAVRSEIECELLYHILYIHLKKNNVIELIFPYSKLEDGGNCVPMYSNKCS